MTREIICPQCGFSRSVPEEKIPPGVRWATCPKCRNRFELPTRPETVPGSQAREEESERTEPPWERRSDIGFWSALYATIKGSLFSPRMLFGAMPFQAGWKDPLAFGLLCGVLGTMGGLFWQFLLLSGSLQSYANLGQIGMGVIFTVVMLLCIPYVLLVLVLTSLVIHGCLILVRGGKSGFEATFRVIAYSQATQILSFFPFLGGMAAVVWLLITQLIGLKAIHETSYGRIVLAYLIPLLLLVCGIAFAVVFLFLSFWRS
jgi:hypothetical protein